MSHARTQVRNAVVTALTGLATTGARVYAGRTRVLAVGHQPTLLVYARETRSEPDSRPPRKLMHTLTLVVEGRVSNAGATAAAATEAQLDQIELEVATAIAANATLGGLVLDVLPVRSTLNAQAPGERHEGEVRIEFEIEYRTAESAPGVIVS